MGAPRVQQCLLCGMMLEEPPDGQDNRQATGDDAEDRQRSSRAALS
jgi:hypothetical protein